MECFNPVKVSLSEDAQKKRQCRTYLPLHERYRNYIYVPCGKCAACLSRRRSSWSFRLFQEVKGSTSCYFITLTYDDFKVPFKVCDDGNIHEYVSKKDVQLFLKRFRKSIEPFKIRYFLVSEYGPKTFRPHYHMLLFNFPYELRFKISEYVDNAWSNGFVRVDPVSPARVNYVTSYCLDSSTLPPYLPKNFMLCSRKPGLGSSYLDNPDIVRYHHRTLDGFGYIPTSSKAVKSKLPRYYSDRIFSDDERDKINSEVLDYFNEQRTELYRLQESWLIDNGYDVNERSIQTPFDGSPLFLKMVSKDEFLKSVQRKCKMKKNG